MRTLPGLGLVAVAISPDAVLYLASLAFAAHSYAGAGRLRAQDGSTSLQGVIEDASGARIATAAITITDSSRGFRLQAVTDAQGTFIFGMLPPGAMTSALPLPEWRRKPAAPWSRLSAGCRSYICGWLRQRSPRASRSAHLPIAIDTKAAKFPSEARIGHRRTAFEWPPLHRSRFTLVGSCQGPARSHLHSERRSVRPGALLRSRSAEQAALELEEMEATTHARAKAGPQVRDSLLRRKYVIPFLLACVILFCNTATGVNSIIGYNTGILLQSGLSDLRAHWGYVIFTVVNFLATIDRHHAGGPQGPQVFAGDGTSGVIVALVCVALLFRSTEKLSVDCRDAVQALVAPESGIDAAL